MDESRISYHGSVRRLYEKIRADGMTNVWDRYAAQGLGGDPDRRCTFCMQGVRCDLCSNGPCRADAAADKRGVCGITADGMAMRMLLLRNVMGASTYQYHAEQAVRTLRAAARGETPGGIREPGKLRTFAGRLGLDVSGSDEEIALRVCDAVEEDFARKYYEESLMTASLAPAERQDLWRRLRIFPGGIQGELMLATSSCLTNVDGFYKSLALKAMRLGIATAYQSQIAVEFIHDILYGIPRPHTVRVDLGVLDPAYVNVLPNGHEPFLGFALVRLARTEEWREKARAVGARGIRVIACIETGQEMIQRWETDDVFYGFTGNWLSQEAVLATGCVDLFAADMNCSMPIDPLYADRYGFRLVPLSELVVFEGVEERVDYVPEKAEEQAARLLEMAIENFPRRTASVEPVRGLPVRNAVAGFSPESITDALGGTLDPLLDAVKAGKIHGIAGLVSCTSLRDTAQDVHSVRVAEGLIRRNILVLSLGCGNAAMQVAGLCDPAAADKAGDGLREVCRSLGVPPVLSFGTCTDTGRLADLLHAVSTALGGVPIPDLPVVAAAPEYMEQKATIDAVFALALGVYTYVNPVPPVTGAPALVRLLTEECADVTGGILDVEPDPEKAVEKMAAHIAARRRKLGI